MQLAQGAPQLYDLPYLHRQMLEVLGIQNAEKLVKLDEDQKPRDPVSENMSVFIGKPVKAFIAQDHEAHITVHQTAMQDPKLAQIMGQNPQAQAIMAAFSAHIQEHLAFNYRKQIEEQAGVPYPAPDAEMDEETEVQVSRLAAAAAQQLLQKDQAEVAQKQAQQQQQDPLIQMQQKELEIKGHEVEIKRQKLLVDGATAKDKLELEEKRLGVQERIAGLQVGAKIATDKANLTAQQHEAGLRMGVDIAREMAQQAQTKAQESKPEETE
jgi:hypothetical protein